MTNLAKEQSQNQEGSKGFFSLNKRNIWMHLIDDILYGNTEIS